jgi:peptide deformylase
VAGRPILKVGDPALRRPAALVTPQTMATAEFQRFVDDLVATMHAAHGAGLAAPQVGVGWRVCAVHVRSNPRYPYKPDFPLTIFVNPTLTPLAEADGHFATAEIYEGCLSVPDLRGRVRRHLRVRVEAVDRHGAPFSLEAAGLSAATLQHELDHLDGRLFLDAVTDATTLTTWANFDAHHRASFVAEALALNARFAS